jgi:hypothetical protein
MSHPYIIRFGRSDDTAIKTLFEHHRKAALKIANALAYVFWLEHSFKASECHDECTRFERNGFWIEFKVQLPGSPEYLFQGD